MMKILLARQKLLFRTIVSVMVFLFGTNMVLVPVSFAQVAFLPAAGSMVNMTPKFDPMVVKGIKLYPDNPFKFDFIVDTGDMTLSRDEIKTQGQRLASYFLASLTTPEKEMWVNLSPYEKSRIIPSAFGDTEMGKELLSEDYMLKQIMATALYPERQLGKEFWQRVYSKSSQEFGTTNVPVSTFNKVWIVPDEALVYENAQLNSVFVVQSRLKVMLEQDYLAFKNNQRQPGDMFKSELQRTCPQAGCQANERLNVKAPQGNPGSTSESVNALGSQIIRQIVIPALTKEVNEGKNFAGLRQVYQSLILAAWYKKNLKDNVLAKGYVDRNKTLGVDTQDKQITEKIYQQYLRAYRKGVYNYIKEEIDPATQQMIPRKYFSGGVNYTNMAANLAMASEDQVRSFSADMAMRTGKRLLLTLGVGLFLAAGLPAVAHAAGPGNFQQGQHLTTAQLNAQSLEEAKVLARQLGAGGPTVVAPTPTPPPAAFTPPAYQYDTSPAILKAPRSVRSVGKPGSQTQLLNLEEAKRHAQPVAAPLPAPQPPPAVVAAPGVPSSAVPPIVAGAVGSVHVQPNTNAFSQPINEPTPASIRTYLTSVSKYFSDNQGNLKGVDFTSTKTNLNNMLNTLTQYPNNQVSDLRTTINNDLNYIDAISSAGGQAVASAGGQGGGPPDELIPLKPMNTAPLLKVAALANVPSASVSMTDASPFFQPIAPANVQTGPTSGTASPFLKTDQLPITYPFNTAEYPKVVTAHVGPRGRGHHDGVDYGLQHAPIFAPATARVVFAGDRGDGYGKQIEMEMDYRGHHYDIKMAHLSRIYNNVQAGALVPQFTPIGVTGNSGHVTGKTGLHLHYEITEDGNLVDYEYTLRPTMEAALRDQQRIVSNKAMISGPGGIDLEKLILNTKGGGVRTAFSDPRILQLLLEAKGLFPQIQSIELMTVPMVEMLLGFNTQANNAS